MLGYVLALAVGVLAPQAEVVDPALRSAVERFYATQEAEDVDAYLSLWSSTAERPRPEQLKYVFDSGDDKFSQITITSVRPRGALTVVFVSVTRDRTSTNRRPDGAPIVFHTSFVAALTFAREGAEWKLMREGTPIDALADAFIAAPDAAGRDRLLVEEPDLVGPLLVSAISRQGAYAAQRGLYPRAQQLYERALDVATRIGDKKLQADALQNIGNTLYYQRNLGAAKPIYEQFLAIERELGNDEGIATALVGLGTAQYSQFEYTDAYAAFKEALAIQERLNDPLAVATTLISTGNVQFVEGDFNGAIIDYRRSRDLYRAASNTGGEARALDGLGRSFAAQGDLAAALDAFNGVLEEGRSRKDPGRQGGALFSIGDVHVRLGNLDVARELFDQSRAQFERISDLPNVGHAWQAMGRTDLLSGRFAAAEETFARSAGVCTKGEDPECVAHATVGGGFAQSLQQHHAQAVTSYRKAIALFTTLKKREEAARAEIGLSQALTGSGDYAGALMAARHAESEGTAIGQDDVVWRALVANARAQRRLTNSSAASVAAKSAVDQVERMAQRAFDGVGDQPSLDSAGVYALLSVLQAEANDPVAAFATVERQRVHSLRIRLARNERDIARGMTPAERDAERQLAAEVVTVRAQLDHERALPKPNAPRLERLRQQMNAAVEKRSLQRQEFFTRLPDLRIWRGLVAPITLDETVKRLDERETLVEFVIDDDDLLVLLAFRGPDGPACRAYLTPVPRQTLAERISRASDLATLRDVSLWRQASVELMKSIPSGAWSAISDAPKVVLIPDDVLWRVPFEALPVGDGFLADRTTVLYAGSATSLFQIASAMSVPPAQPIVAVTAPEIPQSTRDRLQATAPGWALRSGDATDAEMQAIAAVFDDPPATILSGSSATESAFRDRVGSAAIIAVAAPFRMNGASPLFSSILLTPDSVEAETPPEKDGILEAREVINLELHGALTVFTDGSSASMRGAASAAEVVSWVWRAAGIPAIVLPRWVAEEQAPKTMWQAIYSGVFKGGAPPELAVRDASSEMRAAAATRAPYYWAAWQVIGR
jgi:tetratricopeptide (TPR) repeat protein/CHAT domain-containing protein